MNIKINEREYRLVPDIKLGIMMRMQKDPENPDNISAFLNAVLKPSPTEEEIEEFKMSDFIAISEQFAEAQKNLQTNFKKKLS